jgi:energy-coupling factor transport system substrate-specific component
MNSASVKRLSMSYSTTDIAIMAILGVAFGLLNLAFSSLWTVVSASFGILGGAAIQCFFIAPCLAAWLIRRPGVFLITYMIASLTNMLAGNPVGVLQLYWGFAGGLAGEIGWAIFGYMRDKIVPGIILGCIIFVPLANVVTYFAFGWAGTPVGLFVLSLVIGMIANVVESGLVGIGLGKAIANMGLLKGYPR